MSWFKMRQHGIYDNSAKKLNGFRLRDGENSVKGLLIRQESVRAFELC